MSETTLTKEKSYLLGLITGRGHIFLNSKIIAIEFSHANEIVEGIAHCPKCGYLATKNGDNLRCKNPACESIVDKSVKNTYNQPIETVESLTRVIIPFLNSGIPAAYEIIGNKSMTLLVIDFEKSQDVFDEIVSIFNPDLSFDRFHIPKILYKTERENKIEYINGLLDTSGFPSPGGWLNRDGENGHGRMRVYFQVVRNWHLPVEIDNFLRSEFKLPIHTIDWGHPNIRDANLEDYFNTRPTSWSREHQIKFFPEYYKAFSFRISSKQSLFQELRAHNEKVVFDIEDDWFPPSKITRGKIKAYHPGEADLRIPKQARKHFDAFWQINLAMGCAFLSDLQKKSKNPEYFALTGDPKTEGDVEKIKQEFEKIRKEKESLILAKKRKTPNGQAKKEIESTKVRLSNEQETYAPLVEFFKKYLSDHYQEPADAFDTSAGNLNLFLENGSEDLVSAFDYCAKFRIRPDVVGFLMNTKRLGFIESKITSLDLKALGQLLGYCLVAQPEEAILVSTKRPAVALVKILKARPDLLEYAQDKKIKLAFLNEERVEFISI